MASTIAMFTGLSGLNANARNLDVTGNNIANVNTTSFKSTRLLFASQFSRNLGLGSVPSEQTGGTNPRQVGLGVTIAGTQRNFGIGSLSATGSQTDMAISGDGFFMVNRGVQRFFTRAGAFNLNANRELVNVSGDRVMGWGVDNEFAVNRSTLVPITIPVGQLRIAEATRTAQLNGTLNNASNSVLATSGSRFDFGALTDTSGPISNTSLVTNLRNAGGSPIGVVGSTITLDGARTNATGQGSGTVLPDSTLTITATTTVNDLLSFINQGLRITTGGGANPDGFTPGATLNAGTGVISIVGNTGRANNLQFDSSNFVVTPPGGGAGTQPLTGITNIAQANGESTRTTRPVFDSLGNSVSVEVTVTLVSRGGPSGGSTWRYEVTSPDDTDGDPRVATGLVNFDENGRYIGEPGVSISINRQAVGAAEPLTFTLDFSRVNAAANPTAGAAGASNSSINFAQVDGSPLGTLTSFAVGADGTISGSFDNGRTRTIGQVALATFSNPEGLVDAGQNLYGVGANSGNPQIVIPGDAGAGGIVGGSLELSNVDLSNEFINLILSSTGYSAASRVISTSDQLLQQLLVIGR